MDTVTETFIDTEPTKKRGASNSNKSKQQTLANKSNEKRTTKVVKGSVKTKKKSKTASFIDKIISEDSIMIRDYVFGDVLIPAVKKAISDIVTNGIDIILYGGGGQSSNRRSTRDRVSYSSYYDSRDNDEYKYSSRPTRASYRNEDYVPYEITLESRREAEEVMDMMDELLGTYGVVRVADMYDLVGMTGRYTDNKYGWTDLRNSSIVRVRDGYLLKMPRAIPID